MNGLCRFPFSCSLVDRVEALGALWANESVSLTASVTETVTGNLDRAADPRLFGEPVDPAGSGAGHRSGGDDAIVVLENIH